ncbi:MAG TPA: hypothetical protein PLX58_08605 [Smithellaceae bacterium]|jgi:hypothetical protein|nr:hypothetical protein [Smithellaceae bacterium]HQF85018.1 hypothetical protein [Smithellaceae bacterium]HQG80696.1 hypothetical protein [Smithellaceae bacterium]
MAAKTGITMFQASDEDWIPPVTAGSTEKCQTNEAITKFPMTLNDLLIFKTNGAIAATQIMTQKMLIDSQVNPILYHLITLGRKNNGDN